MSVLGGVVERVEGDLGKVERKGSEGAVVVVVAVVVAEKGETAAQASSHGWFRRRGGGRSARGARRMRQLEISSPPSVEVCPFFQGE